MCTCVRRREGGRENERKRGGGALIVETKNALPQSLVKTRLAPVLRLGAIPHGRGNSLTISPTESHTGSSGRRLYTVTSRDRPRGRGPPQQPSPRVRPDIEFIH